MKPKKEDLPPGPICLKGDPYDKATTLLKELVQKHPFASGNRRTAFITTKAFLKENKQRITTAPTAVLIAPRRTNIDNNRIAWTDTQKRRKQHQFINKYLFLN